jgi:1-acyl-sn-glycerol-3-phosphate acyltransferase
MTLAMWAVNGAIRNITRLICRIDDSQLAAVPAHGPLILVANHINSIEVPLVFTHLQPRPVTGFAKAESWENPFKRVLFDFWGAIPLRRGEADVTALRKALDALQAGKILAVAPEGTRSYDGRLQRGHPGVVMLALRSRAPLLSMVYYGSEKLWNNLPRLRRTDFAIRVGHPFYLEAGDERITQAVRQQMTDEIMFQLAALLPEAYRGEYSNLEQASRKYLRFLPGRAAQMESYPLAQGYGGGG